MHTHLCLHSCSHRCAYVYACVRVSSIRHLPLSLPFSTLPLSPLQASLLKQLSVANESVGGGVVVVMAEREKEDMEMDIARMDFDLRGTKVICR